MKISEIKIDPNKMAHIEKGATYPKFTLLFFIIFCILVMGFAITRIV